MQNEMILELLFTLNDFELFTLLKNILFKLSNIKWKTVYFKRYRSLSFKNIRVVFI